MKKRILISLLTAAMALSLAACGDPEKKDNAESKAVVNKGGAVNGYRMETQVSDVGKNDSLTELTGCFIETIDGKETGYISINDSGATYIEKGATAPMPIGIESSDEGIMIYHISRPPVDLYTSYSFDGTTLKYEYDDIKYEWTKVDFFPVEGRYIYKKVNQSGSEIWTFNADGTGSVVDPSNQETAVNNFTFTQDKDKIVIENSDGKKSECTYVYDKASLVLEMGTTVISMAIG